MMWTDYFLKFENEAEWLAVAPQDCNPQEMDIQVYGIFYRDDTPEGQEPVARPGYHVNLRLRGIELPESLKPFAIEAPEHPARVYA